MAAAAEPVRGAEASDVGRDGHQHTSMVTSGMAFPSPSTSIQQTSPIPLRCRIGSVGPRASSGANRLPPDCRSSTAGRHGCRQRSPRRSRRARCVARRAGSARPRSDRRRGPVRSRRCWSRRCGHILRRIDCLDGDRGKSMLDLSEAARSGRCGPPSVSRAPSRIAR